MPAKIDFSQVRVLIVDPNPLSIELTCDVLAMMGGLTARRCLTTDRALHVLRSEPVDIVITEWNTAPLNGLQFIDYVRNSPQSPNRLLPILLMTARSEQPYVVQARDRGITEFLAKPFTVESFHQRLVLQSRKLNSEGVAYVSQFEWLLKFSDEADVIQRDTVQRMPKGLRYILEYSRSGSLYAALCLCLNREIEFVERAPVPRGFGDIVV